MHMIHTGSLGGFLLQSIVCLLSYSRLKVENKNASAILYLSTKCTVSQILVWTWKLKQQWHQTFGQQTAIHPLFKPGLSSIQNDSWTYLCFSTWLARIFQGAAVWPRSHRNPFKLFLKRSWSTCKQHMTSAKWFQMLLLVFTEAHVIIFLGFCTDRTEITELNPALNIRT